MMTKPREIDKDGWRPPGWAEPREVKEEPHVSSLASEGHILNWAAKASARSGPKFAPGLESGSSRNGTR